jgi:hypothetical protein
MMYAEFVACYESTGQEEWFMKFVPKFRVVNIIEKSLKIYCDNELTVQYFYNNKKSDTVNHINIKYYVVKEKIQVAAWSAIVTRPVYPANREPSAFVRLLRFVSSVDAQCVNPSSLWLSSLYSLAFI